MLDGPSQPCVPPVWVCFCDSVAPEGPFTTFTALLAPFQSWCFFLFFAAACSPMLSLNRCNHYSAWWGETRHTNKYVFFLAPIASPKALPPAKNICRKKVPWTQDWKFFVRLCVFSLVLPRTFSHSCAAASVALYAWRAQGYFHYIHPHSHTLKEQHCLGCTHRILQMT